MTIGTNSVVAFHYALTNDAGETLDSSNGRDPLSFLFGHGGIIPGLEAEFEGRSVGDKFDATIDPEHAYGVKDDTLVQEVPLSALSAIADLAVGMQLQSQTPGGSGSGTHRHRDWRRDRYPRCEPPACRSAPALRGQHRERARRHRRRDQSRPRPLSVGYRVNSMLNPSDGGTSAGRSTTLVTRAKNGPRRHRSSIVPTALSTP